MGSWWERQRRTLAVARITTGARKPQFVWSRLEGRSLACCLSGSLQDEGEIILHHFDVVSS